MILSVSGFGWPRSANCIEYKNGKLLLYASKDKRFMEEFVVPLSHV